MKIIVYFHLVFLTSFKHSNYDYLSQNYICAYLFSFLDTGGEKLISKLVIKYYFKIAIVSVF